MPTWTMEERSRLLLTIIELLAPQKSAVKMPAWPQVAEKMGSGFSGEAVRQQYQKLRKEGLPHNRKTLKRAKKGQTGIKNETGFVDDEEYFSTEDEALINKRIKREKGVKAEKVPTPPPSGGEEEAAGDDMPLGGKATQAAAINGGSGPVLKMEGKVIANDAGGDELYE